MDEKRWRNSTLSSMVDLEHVLQQKQWFIMKHKQISIKMFYLIWGAILREDWAYPQRNFIQA